MESQTRPMNPNLEVRPNTRGNNARSELQMMDHRINNKTLTNFNKKGFKFVKPVNGQKIP